MNRRTQNFLDLYFAVIDENAEEIKQQLEKDGVDIAQSEQNIMQLIKNTKAQIKLEKGRKFKESALKVITQIQNEKNSNIADTKFKIAARNLTGFDEQDKIELKKNDKILEELGKFFED